MDRPYIHFSSWFFTSKFECVYAVRFHHNHYFTTHVSTNHAQRQENKRPLNDGEAKCNDQGELTSRPKGAIDTSLTASNLSFFYHFLFPNPGTHPLSAKKS